MNLLIITQALGYASLLRLLRGRTGVWDNHWGRALYLRFHRLYLPSPGSGRCADSLTFFLQFRNSQLPRLSIDGFDGSDLIARPCAEFFEAPGGG